MKIVFILFFHTHFSYFSKILPQEIVIISGVEHQKSSKSMESGLTLLVFVDKTMSDTSIFLLLFKLNSQGSNISL